MNRFHDLFENALRNTLALHRVGTRLIANKLEDVGVTLTPDQLAAVESQLKRLEGGNLSLAIDLSDEQLANSTIPGERRESRKLDLDLDGEAFFSRFQERLPDIILRSVEDIARLLWKSMRRSARAMLADRKRLRRRFESGLLRVWGTAFDRLEMLREIAVEAGEEFNNEFRPQAAATKDFVFDVLIRLQARACQVASEVLALLRSGHADGAHARWRCLHEIATVGLFIKAHGNEVAEQYLLHDAIESHKAARLYQDHHVALGAEPLSAEEVAAAKATYDALIERFGPPYGGDYGWAASTLGSKRPTFFDLERSVGLDHMRPYYKMASHNVHANPKGVLFRLGLGSDQEFLLAGPSDVGFADPGHGTANALGQITITLLIMNPNIDRLVICMVLLRAAEEVGRAFLAAETAV